MNVLLTHGCAASSKCMGMDEKPAKVCHVGRGVTEDRWIFQEESTCAVGEVCPLHLSLLLIFNNAAKFGHHTCGSNKAAMPLLLQSAGPGNDVPKLNCGRGTHEESGTICKG